MLKYLSTLLKNKYLRHCLKYKNWLPFLSVVKATSLKRQISKFLFSNSRLFIDATAITLYQIKQAEMGTEI